MWPRVTSGGRLCAAGHMPAVPSPWQQPVTLTTLSTALSAWIPEQSVRRKEEAPSLRRAPRQKHKYLLCKPLRFGGC